MTKTYYFNSQVQVDWFTGLWNEPKFPHEQPPPSLNPRTLVQFHGEEQKSKNGADIRPIFGMRTFIWSGVWLQGPNLTFESDWTGLKSLFHWLCLRHNMDFGMVTLVCSKECLCTSERVVKEQSIPVCDRVHTKSQLILLSVFLQEKPNQFCRSYVISSV